MGSIQFLNLPEISYKNWIFKNDGVPVFKDEEINNIALALLEKYSKHHLFIIEPIPIEEILKSFCEEKNFKLKHININSGDKISILGITNLTDKEIFIEKKLKESNLTKKILRMTYAHELGHCVLHTCRELINLYPDEDENKSIIEESEENIDSLNNLKYDYNSFSKKNKLKSNLDWVEHHARVFAASVLMPSTTIKKTLIEFQEEFGYSKNKQGFVYLSDDRNHRKDFEQIVYHISYKYDVSVTSVKYRLAKLKLLIDKRSKVLSLEEVIKQLINEN